jgi:metal-sulfur cluster biosynthetic enzyme
MSTPHAELSSLEKIHAQAEAARHEDDDPHLRSCKAVIDYNIQAIDGDMGHVEGLHIDEETWAIRYLIVNTSNKH